MEENGKIVTGQSADTDTVVASAKAYVNALNKLLVRREKNCPKLIFCIYVIISFELIHYVSINWPKEHFIKGNRKSSLSI